ncbi:MAG: glutathione peroxidase [Pseudomonadota bacterium]
MLKVSRRSAVAGLGLTLAASNVRASAKTAHDFSFVSIEGNPMPLSDFRGSVVMVVNTASLCGFTDQYAGLQSLWDRYRDRGFVLIGAPSNDFGGQEPGSEAEIKEFCESQFAVTFPLTEKLHVKGQDAHPFYAWARSSVGFLAAPKWNFHKYLIDQNGTLVHSFSTLTKPDSPKVTGAIDSLLAQDRGA